MNTSIEKKTSFHLTPEQIDSFDINGYLILRNWIPKPLLLRLQAAGDDWIRQALEQMNVEGMGDFAFAKRDGGREVPYRVNYLHNKGRDASLELLGSPQVLAVAESLCGRNFVPTYESMVFKFPGDGAVIPWHQDAVFPRKYRVFNFDVYLDPSTSAGGALRVIPGSNKHVHDVCCFAKEHGWEHPNIQIVEMEPGDVLLHDDMILHGSPRVEGQALRRTVYYEFRPIEQILEEGPWDREWADGRLRLLPVALKKFNCAFPGAESFEWRIDDSFRPYPIGDDKVELRIAHQGHTVGSYCTAGGWSAEAAAKVLNDGQ